MASYQKGKIIIITPMGLLPIPLIIVVYVPLKIIPGLFSIYNTLIIMCRNCFN